MTEDLFGSSRLEEEEKPETKPAAEETPPRKRGPGRPRKDGSDPIPRRDAGGRFSGTGGSSSSSKRKQQARETILELVELADGIRGRGNGQPEDLADIARRDADRMADAIAAVSVRVPPFGMILDRVLGAGGPLSILLAFGPFVRKLLERMRQIKQERDRVANEFAQRLLDHGAGELELGQTIAVDGRLWERTPEGMVDRGEVPGAAG